MVLVVSAESSRPARPGAGAPAVAFTHAGPGTPARAWREDPRWDAVRPLTLHGVARLVVVAAHPDDESLGAGGLVATAVRAGLTVSLVVATAGEGSHPGSPTHAPADLARRRRQETDAAARALGLDPGHGVRQLDLPDGG
ncbi:MAG: methyltransferase protein, partial [Marmoricola sp.]|nr:methyltransferase protein [Marmoricola sp.]